MVDEEATERLRGQQAIEITGDTQRRKIKRRTLPTLPPPMMFRLRMAMVAARPGACTERGGGSRPNAVVLCDMGEARWTSLMRDIPWSRWGEKKREA